MSQGFVMRQVRTSPSPLADANHVPAGSNATLRTHSVWSRKVCDDVQDAVSHGFTRLSAPPEASSEPLPLKANAHTVPL